MPGDERVLDTAAAQAYYDRFGRKQDSQGFYEDPALDVLVAHANFQDAQHLFEFGCGTGKFAARLLENEVPSSADYLGCDVSPIMIGLATERLEAYGQRARLILADGVIRFPLPERSVDRVVCNYVLDLLSEADIGRFFSEAYRVLVPGGRVCIASLTKGVSLPSRIVSSLWMSIFHLRPALVGGCRPILVDGFVDPNLWQIVHRRILTPFGVPSEVLVLETQSDSKKGMAQ